VIRTPDQRLRVFVSSTLEELREERETARPRYGWTAPDMDVSGLEDEYLLAHPPMISDGPFGLC
jgi:hypothetical protein